ncbi:MAG: hypothetical protein OEW18_00765 [Candidatus Aminicenantes bacterium]|nr:hypothetical protein [Candidatus Aminicenantes bacterium]
MDREKLMTQVLLDLCAFAYTQDGGNGARRDFEAAVRLAEAQSLPETDIYRQMADRVEREIVEEEAAEPAYQVI